MIMYLLSIFFFVVEKLFLGTTLLLRGGWHLAGSCANRASFVRAATHAVTSLIISVQHQLSLSNGR